MTAILRVTQKRLFKTAFCILGYSIITYIQDFDRQFSTYSRALRVDVGGTWETTSFQ